MEKPKILFIDDEINNLNSAKASFRDEFDVFVALGAKDAWSVLEKHNDIQVAIIDYRMPVESGLDLIVEMHKKHPRILRILISGFGDREIIIRSLNEGRIFKYMDKPWNEDTLRSYIREGHREYTSYFILMKKIEQLIKEKTELETYVKSKLQEI